MKLYPPRRAARLRDPEGAQDRVSCCGAAGAASPAALPRRARVVDGQISGAPAPRCSTGNPRGKITWTWDQRHRGARRSIVAPGEESGGTGGLRLPGLDPGSGPAARAAEAAGKRPRQFPRRAPRRPPTCRRSTATTRPTTSAKIPHQQPRGTRRTTTRCRNDFPRPHGGLTAERRHGRDGRTVAALSPPGSCGCRCCLPLVVAVPGASRAYPLDQRQRSRAGASATTSALPGLGAAAAGAVLHRADSASSPRPWRLLLGYLIAYVMTPGGAAAAAVDHRLRAGAVLDLGAWRAPSRG